MCVPRDSHHRRWESVQDTGEQPLLPALVANAPVRTLDQMYPTHVLTRASPDDVQETLAAAHCIAELEARMGAAIAGAPPGAREDGFWDAGGAEGQGHAVSRYYRRCFVADRHGVQHAVEPCTGVAGDHAVLCVELFFDRSNATVYRDVRTPLASPLALALAVFSQAQGLPAATAYTYLRHTAARGWEFGALSAETLALPVSRALQLPHVRDSYNADFFRLSPADVREDVSGGVLVSLL